MSMEGEIVQEPTADVMLAGHDLSGKRAIVTGASSGVGVAIAGALAGAGAAVTLAVRDTEAGRSVASAIALTRDVEAPEVHAIDLLSMASVRAFVRDWGDRPLDLLINNAGLMGPPLTRTADGFESQMAVNYFGPFLLSELLLPNLKAAADPRVVVVSSGSHHLAELRIDDLNYLDRPYDKFEAYGHAKLCANLLAVEYSRRHAGDGVTMNVATPGGVATNLGRHVTFEDAVRLGWINEDGSLPQGRMRTPEEGAASPIWAAVAPELAGRGGLYIEDCAIAPVWTPPTPSGWGVTRASLDPESARLLWDAAWPLLEESAT
ncbi:NAD(P)-dependent dehydrogenase (short-subunit alcohol dehydrogenase family) [Sphingobium sp. OAS761]|uniref:SDR family NAD(P)-dependent oxidoreductase n=1 Tax=Sphingobium sp. OAS761 TaxID=2817901 RepID=UPI00209DC984|nr:SDR family NAD(P)-dependent oxidoreductase [Sphingobium sp. OAS761]MCP1470274.1 NAD(P)-dependent dehydrogenase (short-subunit alcohol dehydrogenase family) [Sphingobium sp. OAS761]